VERVGGGLLQPVHGRLEQVEQIGREVGRQPLLLRAAPRLVLVVGVVVGVVGVAAEGLDADVRPLLGTLDVVDALVHLVVDVDLGRGDRGCRC